jgi:hypothetical protein
VRRPVVDIGRSHVAGDGQAQGVDQQVALPALNAFVRVVAADAGGFLDRLHTLAVHDGRTWVGVATDSLPRGAMQGRVQQTPDTMEAEPAELVEDRLPGREVGGQVAPGAARA